MATVQLRRVHKRLRPPVGTSGGARAFHLRDLDLAVTRGEAVALLGSNGAGKSTLLRLVAGVLRPDSGDLHVPGSVSPVITFRSPFQPDLTLAEHVVAFSELTGHKLSVDEVLRFAGLEEQAHRPTRLLSTGQGTRLALASLVASRPDVYLIDEALEVCDPRFRDRVFDLLRRRCREGAVVLLSGHNVVTARSLCSRGLLLDDGRIEYDGEIEEALLLYLARKGRRRDPAPALPPGLNLTIVNAPGLPSLRLRAAAPLPALQVLITVRSSEGEAHHSGRTSIPAGAPPPLDVPLPLPPSGAAGARVSVVVADEVGTVLLRDERPLNRSAVEFGRRQRSG